jgi:cardiolipin synthase
MTRWPTLALIAAWATLTVLAGCSSPPVIVSDVRPGRAAAVPLKGAAGPLSASQSKAVLDRLARGGQPSDIFDRHLAREEAFAGSPLTAGNRVRLLRDGPATYQAMIDAIGAARDHVNLETYILEDDEVGQRFAQALLAKRREGVQVNLIHDSAGTIGTPAAFFDRLKAGGVSVLEFHPLNPALTRKEWELNRRDHRKLLIVDGSTAFLGGINISSVYSGGSFRPGSRARGDLGPLWRDTHLQLEGPVVAELQRLLFASWDSQRGPPLPTSNYFPPPRTAGREVVRAIGSSPDETFSQFYATLLSAIASAETSIRLTNAYFVPDPQLVEALEAAVRRGVEVTLILPSKTDWGLVFHAGRSHYARLLRAGVKIHERRGAILHAKSALIDGVWSTVGSTNLDWRSFLHNYELDAVVLGADFGGQMQAMFEADLAASEAITLEDWRRRPVDLWLKEWFSRLWAYWL